VRDFQAGVLELSGTGKKFKCGDWSKKARFPATDATTKQTSKTLKPSKPAAPKPNAAVDNPPARNGSMNWRND
jgi:hypothetical protein